MRLRLFFFPLPALRADMRAAAPQSRGFALSLRVINPYPIFRLRCVFEGWRGYDYDTIGTTLRHHRYIYGAYLRPIRVSTTI